MDLQSLTDAMPAEFVTNFHRQGAMNISGQYELGFFFQPQFRHRTSWPPELHHSFEREQIRQLCSLCGHWHVQTETFQHSDTPLYLTPLKPYSLTSLRPTHSSLALSWQSNSGMVYLLTLLQRHRHNITKPSCFCASVTNYLSSVHINSIKVSV